MQIRNAVLDDLPDILRILDAAKLALRACGVDQWQDGYPNADSVRADIENGTGRVLVENGAVIATAAAGFVFTWLRRRSGSLIAPIALHWSLNGLGALAAALVWHLS